MLSYKILKDASELVKANQPISYTGFLMHALRWPFSKSCDVTTPNPFEMADDIKVGVYCIPGTADRVSAFDPFVQRMVGNLPKEISAIHQLAFDGRGRGSSIQFYADQLAEKIKKNGDKDVILIGHSRGGVIAAWFAEYLARKHGIKVHSVVAIGAPFHGSWWASIPPFSWFPGSVSELKEDSALLKELEEKIKDSDVNYCFVTAENDSIVATNSGFVPKDSGATWFDFSRHGHLSIMSSHRLVEHLKNYFHKVTPSSDELKDLGPHVSEDDKKAALKAIAKEIDERIAVLNVTKYLWKAEYKIKALTKLKELLDELAKGKCCKSYSGVNSIGDFIVAFLQKEKMSDGTKMLSAIDILRQSLNYPLSELRAFALFQDPKVPKSQDLVEGFVGKYRNIPMPANLQIYLREGDVEEEAAEDAPLLEDVAAAPSP